MGIRRIAVVVITLLLTAILISLPTGELFAEAGETMSMYLRKLVNATMLIGVATLLIAYDYFQTITDLHLWRIRNFKSTIPVLALVIVYLAFRIDDIIEADLGPFDSIFVCSVVMVKACSEEMIFRAFLQSYFLRHQISPRHSIALSATLFSSLHIINYIDHRDGFTLVAQLIFSFFAGILLGISFYRTRNILFVTVLHGLINLPSNMLRFANRTPESIETIRPTLLEELFGLLTYCLIYSPMILLAVYQYKNLTPDQPSKTLN